MTRAATARIALLPSLVAALVGCRDRRAKPEAARDATAPAARVVSLSPSTTEAMFAIGAGASLVGRSRYCDYPKEVLALPQVGGFVDPNLEAILALRPDLVIGARGPAGTRITDRLAARGVATFFPPTESFAAIDAMIVGLGDRTGHRAEADARLAALHARVAQIERAVAGEKRARVLMLFGLEPISVAGPDSFADEMLRRAGGDNVVTAGGAYPTLGVEKVLALDPDVILNAAVAATHGHERLGKDAPGWSEVRAVAAGHVVDLPDESVLRPGPRVAEGLAALARAMHPTAAIPVEAAK